MGNYKPYICKFCGHKENHLYNQCPKCGKAGALKLVL